MEELRKNIKETSDRGKTINDLVALVDHYNHELSRILNKHTPEEERRVTLRKPTRWTLKLGNTLDLIIVRKTSILLNHKVDFQISDHNNILFQINMRKPACPQQVVKFRKLKKVTKDIKETSDRCKTINDLVALVDHYNHELSRILDKHAPEEERQVTLRKPTPWTSEDIKLEKQKRRRLERRWRKT